MNELITPKKEAEKKEYTEQELTVFLAGQINAMKIDLPGRFQKAQRSGKYTIQQIMNMKNAAVREVEMLEAILKIMVNPPPKQSSCFWKKDKQGGFLCTAYISAQDLAEIKLPPDDAELVQELIDGNKSIGVLSALSMIFGHWEQQRQRETKEIIDAAKSQMGHA